jgi:hypothetical protein
MVLTGNCAVSQIWGAFSTDCLPQNQEDNGNNIGKTRRNQDNLAETEEPIPFCDKHRLQMWLEPSPFAASPVYTCWELGCRRHYGPRFGYFYPALNTPPYIDRMADPTIHAPSKTTPTATWHSLDMGMGLAGIASIAVSILRLSLVSLFQVALSPAQVVHLHFHL